MTLSFTLTLILHLSLIKTQGREASHLFYTHLLGVVFLLSWTASLIAYNKGFESGKRKFHGKPKTSEDLEPGESYIVLSAHYGPAEHSNPGLIVLLGNNTASTDLYLFPKSCCDFGTAGMKPEDALVLKPDKTYPGRIHFYSDFQGGQKPK
jgi:hypothetical protein